MKPAKIGPRHRRRQGLGAPSRFTWPNPGVGRRALKQFPAEPRTAPPHEKGVHAAESSHCLENDNERLITVARGGRDTTAPASTMHRVENDKLAPMTASSGKDIEPICASAVLFARFRRADSRRPEGAIVNISISGC